MMALLVTIYQLSRICIPFFNNIVFMYSIKYTGIMIKIEVKYRVSSIDIDGAITDADLKII